MALYEPPFMANENDNRSPADHVKQLNKLLAAGRRGDMVEYFMTEITGAPAEAVGPMKNSPMWAELLPMAHTLLYDMAIMGDYSMPTGRISSIKIPTLALDGGASPSWAAKSAQMLADTLPNAQRRTLPGQTHGAAPEVLAPVLVEFFEA
jgi:pimeloyl-ACP methyl ester carboxylesterase